MGIEQMGWDLIITGDGSPSLHHAELDESYHSRNGALAESKHIYIDAGLLHLVATQPGVDTIRIFELGFGTGLNAALALKAASVLELSIRYTSIEPHPIASKIAAEMAEIHQAGLPEFAHVHSVAWDKSTAILPNFELTKRACTFQQFAEKLQLNDDHKFDLIFWDAFGPRVSPQLWLPSVFSQLAEILREGAQLVTYCSAGHVRRALQSAGLKVEKLAGPAGKREIIRATYSP